MKKENNVLSMKSAWLIVLISFTKITAAQTIEQIKSDRDAIAFITNLSSGLSNFRYSKNPNFDSLKNKRWNVSDFDNNGKADLLITGTNDDVRDLAYVVLTGTDNKYTVEDITPGGYFLIPISIVQKIGDEHVIILQQSVSNKKWSDTLIHKFGMFLKYNPSVTTKKISMLHYSSTGCMGNCPVYKLIIDSSTALLEAAGSEGPRTNSNDTLNGTYRSKLVPEKFNELTDLVNYINILSLESHYSVGITDLPTGIIEIVFTDGTFKRIDDYGKAGTPGLKVLHKYLDKLRFTESWKKQNE